MLMRVAILWAIFAAVVGGAIGASIVWSLQTHVFIVVQKPWLEMLTEGARRY